MSNTEKLKLELLGELALEKIGPERSREICQRFTGDRVVRQFKKDLTEVTELLQTMPDEITETPLFKFALDEIERRRKAVRHDYIEFGADFLMDEMNRIFGQVRARIVKLFAANGIELRNDETTTP